MTRTLVYIDLETTGLDPFTHQAFEVAWAVEDGPIGSLPLPHTLEAADPRSLEINNYMDRGFWPRQFAPIHELRKTLVGVTLVGANPAFDSVFLRKALGLQVWHHRLRDIEQMGQWILGLEEAPGLHTLAELLRDKGHQIAVPDHTAAGDVATTRDCHTALLIERAAR